MEISDRQPRPPGWWNDKNHVIEEAKKYKTRTQFKKMCPGAYSSARNNNFLDEMTWFENGTEHYWSTHRKLTREHIFNTAKKYDTIKDFCNGNPSEYCAACRFKMMSDFTWLKRSRNKDGYWTKDVVLKEARKYNSRSAFFKGNQTAYCKSLKNGWIDECSWFRTPTNLFKNGYSIYKFEFPSTKSVYIGLTCRTSKRNYQHHTEPDSAVFKHSKENNIPIPDMVILEENLSQEMSQVREQYWVNVFSSRNWNILNKMKTGLGVSSLGSVSKKWNTKEKVRNEALKYKSRTEF